MAKPVDYLEILQHVSTTNVSDAMDKIGIQGVLDGIFIVSQNESKVFGRVVTVKLTAEKVENSAHLGIEAIELAENGQIIVMGNEGRISMACWGGILSTAASMKGITSVVIDGSCRDIDEINDLGFSVFARSISTRSARNRVYQEALNVPITVSKVRINPNDFILADQNGVVVIPQEHEIRILSHSSELYQLETNMIKNIKSGKSILEVDKEAKYNDLLKMRDED